MATKVTIDEKALVGQLDGTLFRDVRRDFQAAKLRDIRSASRANYRNRTGRLFGSIRIIEDGVAFGDVKAFYWVFIDNKTRGSGQFARRALTDPARNNQVVADINARLSDRRYRIAA